MNKWFYTTFFSFFLVFCIQAQKVETLHSLARQFVAPADKYKPHVWWHWMGSNFSKEGIKKDLNAMKETGVGGVVVFNVPSWLDTSMNPWPWQVFRGKAYWEALGYALAEAKKLNMEVGIHNSPGWSTTGGPWIKPEQGMQAVTFSITRVAGREQVKEPLPNPKTDEDTAGYFRDVAVMAVPIRRNISVADVIDISCSFKDGMLDWQAPSDEEWNVYRVGYAPTMQHTHPTPEDVADISLEADKMDIEATRYHWKNVLTPFKERFGDYIGRTFKSIWIDSYEAKDQNWSQNFRRDFINMKGYDPVRQLVLAYQRGENILNCKMNGIYPPGKKFSDETNVFLRDYADVINRLFLNCLEIGKDMVNEAGFGLCLEPYGSIWSAPFDMEEGVRIADIPVTEFWVHSKEVEGGGIDLPLAAARNGKRIVGAEAFTGMEVTCTFNETPAMLKCPADMGYASGVNRYYLHSWAHNPLDDTFQPGWAFAHYGTHFSRNQTWFEPGKAFFAYLARCQLLLQQGTLLSTDGSVLHRSTPEAEIFFVRNPEDAFEKEFMFPVVGRVPELWDAYTGNIRNTTHWIENGDSTRVTLSLGRDESIFVVFPTNTSGGYALLPETELLGETVTSLGENWKVTFYPKTGEKFFVRHFSELVDFKNSGDKEIKYFSGTAVYETALSVVARDLKENKRLMLDLGELHNMAEIEINGEKVAVLWLPPYKMDITSYVKQGRNSLKVYVTNTWVNQLVGDEQYPEDFEWTGRNQGLRSMTGLPDWLVKEERRPSQKRKTFLPWYYFSKESPLLSAGLIGPVSVVHQDVLVNKISSVYSSCRVYDLQCEYLINPLGIDNPYRLDQIDDFQGFSPLVSWKIEDREENDKQQAYRIVVTDVYGEPVWDSGIQNSSRQHCFIPDSIIASSTFYRWRVGVYNKNQYSCVWSKWACFSIGLLKNDWKGKWIKHSFAPEESHIWFRKEFDLAESEVGTEPVFTYVASMGYHELYVNGEKVDNRVLAPAVSRLDKRVFYVTYDICSLLKGGKNVIAVNYAPGWSMNDYFSRRIGQGLLVQIYGNGKDFSLFSDSTWRCEESYSRNIGRFDFMNMGGELVDGTKYTEEWMKPEFDDKHWGYAVETMVSGQPILSSQMTDPSMIIDFIPAKVLSIITDSTETSDSRRTIYRVDMEQEFTGFLDAGFDGLERGDTVEIMISMRNENPKFVEATYGIGDKVIEEQQQKHLYIARGEEGETFRNRFNYFAGRYIHFRGLRKAPELRNINGLAISSAAEATASFECSDTLYNRIFALDRYTYQMCHTEGVTVDCPNRERLGYGPEGAYQTMWGLGLPYFCSAAHYVKNVRDWADVQSENGFINNVAPQISNMYGCVLNGTAVLNIAWEHFRLYGDKRILELAYPIGKKWLGFLSNHIKDGMLVRYADHGYFLGEWVSPGPVFEYAETEEALFFNNCAYAMTLDFMLKIGRALGEHQDVAANSKKLAILRRALHHSFYNPENGSYLKGDQIRTSFALYAGIVPEGLTGKMEKHLVDKLDGQGYIDIGSFGRYPFYKTILKSPDCLEVVGKLLGKKDYPGYGYFVEKDCTTFPEMWEIDQPNSTVIHTSYTGISAFFIKGLAGIREGSCGSDTILIAPEPVSGLSECKAEVETPYGTVKSNWKKVDDGISYRFTVPFGTVACLRLKNRSEEFVSAGNIVRFVSY